MLKARIKFRKYGHLKFIGHLDVMRYFQKAMRRAEIPIAFTAGYSPHMIMSFASPLGIGLTSDGEYMDIELREPIASKEAVRRLNEVGIEGIEVLSLVEIEDSKKMGGMSIFAGADYLVYPKNGDLPEHWKDQIDGFLSQPAVNILKKTKRSEKEVDILPMIYQMEVRDQGIFMQLAAGSAENLKPNLVMEAFVNYLGEQETYREIDYQFHRLEMYADMGTEERKLVSLESLGHEITEEIPEEKGDVDISEKEATNEKVTIHGESDDGK